MPRYLSLHTLSCLTRQGAAALTGQLAAATQVTCRRVQVSMFDGKMLVEFEAPNREALEAWLQAQRFHYDWIIRVELESDAGKLVPVP